VLANLEIGSRRMARQRGRHPRGRGLLQGDRRGQHRLLRGAQPAVHHLRRPLAARVCSGSVGIRQGHSPSRLTG
jgi:hypothetical protein